MADLFAPFSHPLTADISIYRLLRADVGFVLSYLACCFAVFLACRLLRSGRREFLLAASLAFLLTFFPLERSLLLAGFTALLYPILTQAGRYHRGGLAAASVMILLGFIPFALSASFIATDARGNPLAGLREALLWSFYFRRLISYIHERHCGRILPSLREHMLYFLGLPFLGGRSAVFSFSEMSERLEERPFAEDLRNAGRTIAFALGHWLCLLFLAATLLPLVRSPLMLWLKGGAPIPVVRIWAALLVLHFAYYLYRYGGDQISVGIARLFGSDVRDNYENPLASRDMLDFWRRWNIHFRELVVSLCYYPVILRLTRWRPAYGLLNAFLACSAAFLCHGLFVTLNRTCFSASPASALGRLPELAGSLAIYELLNISLVSLSFVWRRRRRRRSPSATGKLEIGIGIGLTFALRSLCLVFFFKFLNLERAFTIVRALTGTG